MFLHILWQVFNWPAGIIVGNLLASVVWSSLFEWRLTRHHRKSRQHVEAHVRRIHERLDRESPDD